MDTYGHRLTASSFYFIIAFYISFKDLLILAREKTRLGRAEGEGESHADSMLSAHNPR